MIFELFMLFVAFACFLLFAYHLVFGPKKLPWVDVNHYWGDNPSGGKRLDSDIIESFAVDFGGSESKVINELRQNLLVGRVRLGQPLDDVGFEYGVNAIGFQRFLSYWADDYLPRWTQRQDFLNSFPQFTTEIQG